MAPPSCLIIYLLVLAVGWKPEASATGVEPAPTENLIKAIEEGDLDKVENLIEENVDVNYNSGEALSTAARLGYLEIAETLIQAGAHPDGGAENSTEEWKRGNPLYFAIDNNQTDIVDLLLDAGADVNAQPGSSSLLEAAAANGHLEMVEKLLEAGADPNLDGGYALIRAIKKGHVDIVNVFLDAGTDVNARSGWIVGNAASSGNLEILTAILDAGASKENYDSALSSAASVGDLEIVKFMLEKGANASNGLTGAAEIGHAEVVETLLEAGANISYSSPRDPENSPLHHAATKGHIDVIELLVQYGANINAPYAKDNWVDIYGDLGYHGIGWTVMHLAARWGHQTILRKLLDLGADINAVDNKGYTPLHVAVINLKLKVVRELLKLCADTKIINRNGDTALDLAKRTESMLDNPQPSRMLKDLATKLLRFKVTHYPYTEDFMKLLAREVQGAINANETLGRLLEEQTPYPSWSYIQVATRRVFEDNARSGLLKAFEDSGCRLVVGNRFRVDMGLQYSFKCECVIDMGKRLTVKHIPFGTKLC